MPRVVWVEGELRRVMRHEPCGHFVAVVASEAKAVTMR